MFDGVKMPNPRVQAVVRAGKFLKTCLLEADEHRREHARTKPTGLSLEEILKQAGLHIPDVQAAIRNLLGDGVAVTAADDVLAAAQENPDLVKLARELLRLAERGHSGTTAGSAASKDTGEAKAGSSAPPPSSASPDTPPSPVAASATPPNPPPSPVAASVTPPNAPTSAAPPPANVAPAVTPRPKFRPEYTAQGRLAVLQKTSGESPGVPPPDQRLGHARVGDDAALAVEKCSERLTALEQAVGRLSTRVDSSLRELHARVERIEARLSATPAEPPGPVACPEPTSSPELAATTADDAHAGRDTCAVEPPPLVEHGPSSEPIAAEPAAEPAGVSPAPEPVEVGQALAPDEAPSSTAANDPVSDAASGSAAVVEDIDVPEPVDAEDQSSLGSVSESPAAEEPAAQSADDNDEAFALLFEPEDQP